MPTPSQINFYFDYLSGYAYFCWMELQGIAKEKGATLLPHPVVFGKLLDHWGQLGPAEIPPKIECVIKQGLRYGAYKGIPFSLPKFHPFNPLTSLRLSLKEVAGDNQFKVINTLFHVGWVYGLDMGNSEELAKALNKAGLDGHAMLHKTQEPLVKEILKNETSQAIQQGVFGVPTMIIGEELLWGVDQLPFVKLILDGKDPLDKQKAKEAIAHKRAINRVRKGSG